MEKLTLEGLQADTNEAFAEAGKTVGKIASWTIVAVALSAIAIYMNYTLKKEIGGQKETKNG